MENYLQDFLKLQGKIAEIKPDSFTYTLKISAENLIVIKNLYNLNFIEEIKDQEKSILVIENLSGFVNQMISIEFVTSELKRIGFFLTMKDFIISNRFEVPAEFYIEELSYPGHSNTNSETIDQYKAVTDLINRLVTKSKFISDEHNKILCLVHDNSFIEIEIGNNVYEQFLKKESVPLIRQYLDDINSYKEKRTIFFKELLDFLKNEPKGERLKRLLLDFEHFYERCNISFEYYLSNFSFNKVQLELDNSVLEYSKNIRSIINDSQSKLIAIPAAFILGVSQIDYNNPLSLKSIFIVFSAFLFSYILSFFIKNQKNAIEIISDNLVNYKTTYKQSKLAQFESEREFGSLLELIRNSYRKTEIELVEQQKRLNILAKCNWGVSIILLLSVGIVASSKYSESILKIWHQLLFYFRNRRL